MKIPKALLATLLLTVSCSAVEPPQEETSTPSSAQEAQDEGSGVREIEGALAATVEAGGWLLKTEEGEFLLLDVGEYRSQPWFEEGARLSARGRPDSEAVTIHMQGTPFRVESLRPVSD